MKISARSVWTLLSLGLVTAVAPISVPGASIYVDLRATNLTAGAAIWMSEGLLGNFSRVGNPTFVADVAGTGIPGVSFNGSEDVYVGPPSVPDIEGGSDRSVEVWVHNPSVGIEEALVSWGHRGSTRRVCAVNYGNSIWVGAATHWGDDAGWSTVPAANAWHHLVYTYDGNTTIRIYVDGALAVTKTLGGALDTFAGDTINIGATREANLDFSAPLYFSGYFNTVRVYGNQLSASEVAVLRSQGPCRGSVNSGTPALRLEPRTNAFDLVLGSMSSTGAVFLYQAPNLQTLADAPALLLQTNTPLASELRLPVQPASGYSNQAFFAANYWPGRTVDEFGDPEYAPDPVPPEMILLTSGAPDPLVPQQAVTVDFYVTDTTGQLLNLTAPAAVLVLREVDGLGHPDAVVTPPGGLMTNGHLRLTLTIQANTPLDGYTLGLALTLNSSPGGRAKDVTTRYLRSLITLNNIQCQSGQTPQQCLDAWRQANADAGPLWRYPLVGSGHPVSGTFGEWRGEIKPNNNPPELVGTVHKGLDLAAVVNSTVVASRGGVVSCRGTNSGTYLVIDHGTGWFSRYLHLDGSSTALRVGQAVTNGSILARRLHSGGGWKVHLHFEVRLDSTNRGRWEYGMPGKGEDPLQTTGKFDVAAGSAPPQLEEFGLSRQHLGENEFLKGPPTSDVNSPVYLFAKFVDVEGDSRLGLRAMRFEPEGAAQPVEIRPQTDLAIAPLRPPGTGAKGFARYSGTHATNPNRLNYFRYWWRWDTASYATNRSGPRSFTLTGEDYSGATNNNTFTFGPQVKSNTVMSLGTSNYRLTIVAHVGTNALAVPYSPTLWSQPDQYKLEIIQTNGMPLTDVAWTGPMLGGYTRVFSTHLEEEDYTFTLPGDARPPGLRLRASSRLVPDISQEVAISVLPAPLALSATNVTDTSFTARWQLVTNALGYRLDLSTNADFITFVPSYENVDVGSVTNFLLTSLERGQVYYYRIRAYADSVWSEPSNVIKVFLGFTGKWMMVFTFERNRPPKTPPAPRNTWFAFSADIVQIGSSITGQMSPYPGGTFWGSLNDRHFTGTMRLQWDTKDWDELSCDLDATYSSGTGTASFLEPYGQYDDYSIVFTRMQ